MTYDIREIEPISASYARKLAAAEIRTTVDLLEACCSAAGRRRISERTGVTEGTLLKWSNIADLMRVSGIGPQYSELLEAAGVDTIKVLRNRNAQKLAAKMARVHEEKGLAKVPPAARVVRGWIEAAKGLDPKITH